MGLELITIKLEQAEEPQEPLETMELQQVQVQDTAAQEPLDYNQILQDHAYTEAAEEAAEVMLTQLILSRQEELLLAEQQELEIHLQVEPAETDLLILAAAVELAAVAERLAEMAVAE